MRPITLLHLLGMLGGALLITNCGIVTVAAADIPVTTPTDLIDYNSDCSLREAIEAANTDSAVDGCPAGAGADVILIPAGVILLSVADNPHTADHVDTNAAGDLDLLTEITLQGVDARTTQIDGARIDRILHISTTAVVTVADLTLANGQALHGRDSGDETFPPGKGEDGGGILNEGSLTLQRVTVRDNHAGNGGGLYVFLPPPSIDPGAAGRGGGIFNSGRLTITQSAVAGNFAGSSGRLSSYRFVRCASGGNGGGIYNTGALVVANSTIANNRAPDGDGAFTLYLEAAPGDGGSGGGVVNAGSARLDNVVVHGNIAGHGGIVSNGVYTVTGSDGVGGGILTDDATEVSVRNSILAGNRGAFAANECVGALHSLGFNLVQVVDGCTLTGTVDSNIYGLDPGLGPLGLFNSTTLLHYAPYTGAAVDRGDCIDSTGAPVTADQGGTVRPQLRGCDIGAAEATVPDHLGFLPIIGK
ncbi:MAG TPA: CSLREA domain-containing protein [Chloroflexi bacterium]|nr:CSLREA domain-containing protein [Chloroflexota bacterium]